jgi:cytoskeletal protein CcmA (bactofilin family)
MENSKLYDLKIAGSMTVPGGKFKKVSISGAGNITSPVECEDFTVSGMSTVIGDVTTNSMTISGNANINGNMVASALKVSGNIEINGNIKVDDLNIYGYSKISGNVVSNKVQIHGGLFVGGDLTSEELISKGGLNIDGQINSGNIDISVHFPCKVREIGGEKIRVQKGRGTKFKQFIISWFTSNIYPLGLKCDIIECDDVYLECTTAATVRGNNVVIGGDCKIDLVEYKDYYEVSKDSFVKEYRKI